MKLLYTRRSRKFERICFQISFGISLMYKPNKNYGVAVSSLVSDYKTICKAGNYADEIKGKKELTDLIKIS
jgi:hypothetical protein